MTIRARLLLLLVPPLTAFFIFASLFFYFNLSKEILLLASSTTLLLVIGAVFLIADRISKPVRQLNHAAIKIAAGDYATNIQVRGPKEIVELAHTFNTMSQCLIEHMSRLRESSLIRERMYGEYECAQLLQYYMLNKGVDEFEHPQLNIELIAPPLSLKQKGLLLTIDHSIANCPIFTFLEAEEPGFLGLFTLNQAIHLSLKEKAEKNFLACRFSLEEKTLFYDSHNLFPPLVWSMRAQTFIKGSQRQIPLYDHSLIFMYNSGLIEQFPKEAEIEQWLARILRHFATDGISKIQQMVTNELSFLAKKQQANLNYKLLCIEAL